MDTQPKLPPIVVKPLPGVCKKRRHLAKRLMLIAAFAWPALAIGSTAIFTSMAMQGARKQSDGRYYVDTAYGLAQTSVSEMFLGALVCGAGGATILFGCVMTILFVIWFATKD